jgi:uncharacterized protein
MDCCCSTQAANAATPVALTLLFGTGFVISLGHCLGMCGPLVTAVSLAAEKQSRGARVVGATLYQAGRLTTYVAIGALMGLLGSATGLLTQSETVRGWLSVAVGVWMILAGLSLLGVLPLQRWLEQAPIGRVAMRGARSMIASPQVWRRYPLGIANGLLPCGPVAAAAMSAAATFSAARGALSMAAFGLGTVPALLVLGLGAGALIRPALRLRFYRFGAVLVLLIGIQLGLRGMHSFGMIGSTRLGPVVFW